jgi:hypothetical protein
VQCLLGAWYAALLPRSGACYQVRVAELDGYAVVEAKYENNVLVAVATQGGRYDRFVFRFADNYREYDVRVARDVVYTGINFTVLDTGVCLLLNEADELEVFSNRRGAPDVKVIADPTLGGDARLFHDGATAMFARDGRIFRFRLKQTPRSV